MTDDLAATNADWTTQPHVEVERDGVRYTLLGTAHVSKASLDAVRAAIDAGRFDAIAVELDAQRLQSLTDPEALAKLDLVKVIRDLFNEDFSGLIVSGDDAWQTINDYVSSVAPDLVSKLTKYEPAGGPDGPDVFAVHRIDEQLAKALDVTTMVGR